MERFKDWLTVLTLAALCALAGEAQAQVATTQPSPTSPPPAASSTDQSVPNVLVNASSLVRRTVSDAAGREIGEITELMVDVATRRVTYAVLASGGFLGMGQALFAVPFESLTIGQGRNAIVLNARGEILPRAPSLPADQWSSMGDPSYQERILKYWQDASITAAVKWKLATDRLDSLTRIDVTTTQGAVSLSGDVESHDVRRRAEDLTRQVAGVRQVDNDLKVRN